MTFDITDALDRELCRQHEESFADMPWPEFLNLVAEHLRKNPVGTISGTVTAQAAEPTAPAPPAEPKQLSDVEWMEDQNRHLTNSLNSYAVQVANLEDANNRLTAEVAALKAANERAQSMNREMLSRLAKQTGSAPRGAVKVTVEVVR